MDDNTKQTVDEIAQYHAGQLVEDDLLLGLVPDGCYIEVEVRIRFRTEGTEATVLESAATDTLSFDID